MFRLALLYSWCLCGVRTLQCIAGESFSTLEVVTCDVGVNFCAFSSTVNTRQKKTRDGQEVDIGLYEGAADGKAFADDDKDTAVAQMGFGDRGTGSWGCWTDEWAKDGSPPCESVDASQRDSGLLT